MFKDLIGGSTATFPTAGNASANQAHYPLPASKFTEFQGAVLLEELGHLVTSTGQSLTSSNSAAAHRQVRTAVETIARQQVGKFAHFVDQKTSGTSGGNSTGGSWLTRALNTSLNNDISGCSLGSNQITLPAGTYYIEGMACSNNCNRNRLRLRNITAGATVGLGMCIYSPDGASGSGNADPNATVKSKFTLATTSVLELQHFTETTATDGLGFSFSGAGEAERYADVQIWQVS